LKSKDTPPLLYRLCPTLYEDEKVKDYTNRGQNLRWWHLVVIHTIQDINIKGSKDKDKDKDKWNSKCVWIHDHTNDQMYIHSI